MDGDVVLHKPNGDYGSVGGFGHGKLWSLWDIMDRFPLLEFWNLVALLQDHNINLYMADTNPDSPLKPEEIAGLVGVLKKLRENCHKLDLPVACSSLDDAIQRPPARQRELELAVGVARKEIETKLFLFVPSHRARYFELILQSFITVAFPLASKEIISAGNCLATALYTASVFHSMRAAEIGVRVLGKQIGVEFPDKPIELAEWANILDRADSIIVKMKEMPRGTHKDELLSFYSQAAVQFRYFKDAWRVRVAHARETYEESAAIRVFNHTHEFFETLATQLREPTLEELLA